MVGWVGGEINEYLLKISTLQDEKQSAFRNVWTSQQCI